MTQALKNSITKRGYVSNGVCSFLFARGKIYFTLIADGLMILGDIDDDTLTIQRVNDLTTRFKPFPTREEALIWANKIENTLRDHAEILLGLRTLPDPLVSQAFELTKSSKLGFLCRAQELDSRWIDRKHESIDI
jgi:hypothetical protein